MLKGRLTVLWYPRNHEGLPRVCYDTKREIRNLLQKARLHRSRSGRTVTYFALKYKYPERFRFAQILGRRISPQVESTWSDLGLLDHGIDFVSVQSLPKLVRAERQPELSLLHQPGLLECRLWAECCLWQTPRGPRFFVDVNRWIACAFTGVFPDVPVFFQTEYFSHVKISNEITCWGEWHELELNSLFMNVRTHNSIVCLFK